MQIYFLVFLYDLFDHLIIGNELSLLLFTSAIYSVIIWSVWALWCRSDHLNYHCKRHGLDGHHSLPEQFPAAARVSNLSEVILALVVS